METSLLLSAIVGLIALILPFYLLIRRQKNNESKLKQALQNLANDTHANITRFDLWNNRIIGLDEKTSCVFFVHRKDSEFHTSWVDLDNVVTCQLKYKKETLDLDGKKKEVVNGLKLEFGLDAKKGNQHTVTFCFFNSSSDDATQFGYFELKAKEWHKNLDSLWQNIPKQKSKKVA